MNVKPTPPGWGLWVSCFCAVDRPDDHPLKPANAKTRDSLWRKRGYRPLDVRAYRWKDIDQPEKRKNAALLGAGIGALSLAQKRSVYKACHRSFLNFPMNTVRWNVAVSADTDQSLRMFLASQGAGKKKKKKKKKKKGIYRDL